MAGLNGREIGSEPSICTLITFYWVSSFSCSASSACVSLDEWNLVLRASSSLFRADFGHAFVFFPPFDRFRHSFRPDHGFPRFHVCGCFPPFRDDSRDYWFLPPFLPFFRDYSPFRTWRQTHRFHRFHRFICVPLLRRCPRIPPFWRESVSWVFSIRRIPRFHFPSLSPFFHFSSFFFPSFSPILWDKFPHHKSGRIQFVSRHLLIFRRFIASLPFPSFSSSLKRPPSFPFSPIPSFFAFFFYSFFLPFSVISKVFSIHKSGLFRWIVSLQLLLTGVSLASVILHPFCHLPAVPSINWGFFVSTHSMGRFGFSLSLQKKTETPSVSSVSFSRHFSNLSSFPAFPASEPREPPCSTPAPPHLPPGSSSWAFHSLFTQIVDILLLRGVSLAPSLLDAILLADFLLVVVGRLSRQTLVIPAGVALLAQMVGLMSFVGKTAGGLSMCLQFELWREMRNSVLGVKLPVHYETPAESIGWKSEAFLELIRIGWRWKRGYLLVLAVTLFVNWVQFHPFSFSIPRGFLRLKPLEGKDVSSKEALLAGVLATSIPAETEESKIAEKLELLSHEFRGSLKQQAVETRHRLVGQIVGSLKSACIAYAKSAWKWVSVGKEGVFVASAMGLLVIGCRNRGCFCRRWDAFDRMSV